MSLTPTFLAFSHWTVIIPIILFCWAWSGKTMALQAVYLILFCMIVNVALKVSFQIPLSPALAKEGFAFPSGHMQLSTVFYTWIAYKIKSTPLRGLIVGLLIGIGLSLIEAGYHNGYDVIAGIVVGLLLVALYAISSLKWPHNTLWCITTIASLLMLYIALRWPPIPFHAWVAYLLILPTTLVLRRIQTR